MGCKLPGKPNHRNLKFKNKKAATFGCYGWHDVSTKAIEIIIRESGFEILTEPFSCLWEPDNEVLNKSFEYGKQFATLLNEN